MTAQVDGAPAGPPADGGDGPEEGKAGGRGWAVLLLRLLGLGLLVLVIWQVDWRDSIRLLDGTQLRGRLVGELPLDWAGAESITLDVADPADGGQGGGLREVAVGEIATERIGDVDVPVVNEGIVRIVRRADPLLLLLGFFVFGVGCHLGIARWWRLLRAQEIRVPFLDAHRLTFLGMFFNNVVPGATGGDLVKAVYVARRTHKRAEAVVTVLVDRVTGIIALALIAAFVLVGQLDDPRYRELAFFVFGFLGCVAVVGVLFFSRRIRGALRVDAIAARLPGGGILKKVDEAMFIYRYQKRELLWAMLLSFGNQGVVQTVAILYGTALHMSTRGGGAVTVSDYLVALPVGFIVSAIPALPGGWGLRETAFAASFYFIGVDRNPAVALSVMMGVNMLLWSLLGGVYFLQGRHAAAEPDPAPGTGSEPGPAEPGSA